MLDEEIKNTAMDIIKKYNTNDPFEICDLLGIKIVFKNYNKDAKAFFYEVSGNKIIYINSNYTNKAKKIFCAHELGHILLAHRDVNNFESENLKLEREANLFALYMLFDENDFDIKFKNMNGYLIKTILDENIKFKGVIE